MRNAELWHSIRRALFNMTCVCPVLYLRAMPHPALASKPRLSRPWTNEMSGMSAHNELTVANVCINVLVRTRLASRRGGSPHCGPRSEDKPPRLTTTTLQPPIFVRQIMFATLPARAAHFARTSPLIL